jgi:Xaa-Pro aminopeptidase
MELYVPPLLAPGHTMALEAGMAMNIEAPYYELGLGALMLEETLVVRDEGVEMLTTLSQQLEIIE